MRFNVPRIYRPIELGDYAKALKGQQIFVWVNPPQRLLDSYWKQSIAQLRLNLPEPGAVARIWQRIRKAVGRTAGTDRAIVAWYARIWSEDQSRPIDEGRLIEFGLEVLEADPALWEFLVAETWRLIEEHRVGSKKALAVPSGA